MRAVIDTNVLISALISPNGTPGRILRHLEEFTIISSSTLVAELVRVLHYKHIAKRYVLDERKIDMFLERLGPVTELVGIPQTTPRVSRDPDDDKFLACAIAGRADYVVSGDQHLLEIGEYKDVRILTPFQFLALLEPSDFDR